MPINVVLSGTMTLFREEHSSNAKLPMRVVLSETMTLIKLAHHPNTPYPRVVTALPNLIATGFLIHSPVSPRNPALAIYGIPTVSTQLNAETVPSSKTISVALAETTESIA